MDSIINSILSWKITDIPASIDLNYFSFDWYSVSQCTQLIKKGFNPKIVLYLSDEEAKKEYTTLWTERLGTIYEQVPENFWFCFDTLKCNPTCSAGCPDKKRKFIYSAGFRVETNKKIGQGD